MKNPLMTLFNSSTNAIQPVLLQQEIKYSRSVIHASIQASGRAINEALGVMDDSVLDEFLATEAGKKWMDGFRQYAAHAVMKVI